MPTTLTEDISTTNPITYVFSTSYNNIPINSNVLVNV